MAVAGQDCKWIFNVEFPHVMPASEVSALDWGWARS